MSRLTSWLTAPRKGAEKHFYNLSLPLRFLRTESLEWCRWETETGSISNYRIGWTPTYLYFFLYTVRLNKSPFFYLNCDFYELNR